MTPKKADLLRLFVGPTLVSLLFTGAMAHEPPPIKATVCSISSNPGYYAAKLVSVSAQLNSDGIERTALVDSQCPDYGLAISTPEHYKGEEEVANALNKGHPGTLDKTISGTFIGQFVWKPKEIPKRILILKEVHDISTVMK